MDTEMKRSSEERPRSNSKSNPRWIFIYKILLHSKCYLLNKSYSLELENAYQFFYYTYWNMKSGYKFQQNKKTRK